MDYFNCLERKMMVDDLIEVALDKSFNIDWVIDKASKHLEVTEKIRKYIEYHLSDEYKNIYFTKPNDQLPPIPGSRTDDGGGMRPGVKPDDPDLPVPSGDKDDPVGPF